MRSLAFALESRAAELHRAATHPIGAADDLWGSQQRPSHGPEHPELFRRQPEPLHRRQILPRHGGLLRSSDQSGRRSSEEPPFEGRACMDERRVGVRVRLLVGAQVRERHAPGGVNHGVFQLEFDRRQQQRAGDAGELRSLR